MKLKTVAAYALEWPDYGVEGYGSIPVAEVEKLLAEVFAAYSEWLTAFQKVRRRGLEEWDLSGEICDNIELTNRESEKNTFSDFLEAYTGEWKPTYISGCGKYHVTHGDRLEEYIWEFVWGLVRQKDEEKVDEIHTQVADLYDFVAEYFAP